MPETASAILTACQGCAVPHHKDKERLYIALYARDGKSNVADIERRYHWGLILAPKEEDDSSTAVRLHARNEPSATKPWVFEMLEVPTKATERFLVRVLIGKVVDAARVIRIVKDHFINRDDPNFNCRAWVKGALNALRWDEKAMGTLIPEWEVVSNAALEYVQEKINNHRFDGTIPVDYKKPATFDLLKRKEVIS